MHCLTAGDQIGHEQAVADSPGQRGDFSSKIGREAENVTANVLGATWGRDREA